MKASIVLAALVLSACGGGGGDEESNTSAPVQVRAQQCCIDATFDPVSRTFTERTVPIGQSAGPGRLICKADSAHWSCA
jgi:hypothetical protein